MFWRKNKKKDTNGKVDLSKLREVLTEVEIDLTGSIEIVYEKISDRYVVDTAAFLIRNLSENNKEFAKQFAGLRAGNLKFKDGNIVVTKRGINNFLKSVDQERQQSAKSFYGF